MTSFDHTPYANLSDEELLARVYMDKQVLPALVIELATRLEHALDELRCKPLDAEAVLIRTQGQYDILSTLRPVDG